MMMKKKKKKKKKKRVGQVSRRCCPTLQWRQACYLVPLSFEEESDSNNSNTSFFFPSLSLSLFFFFFFLFQTSQAGSLCCALTAQQEITLTDSAQKLCPNLSCTSAGP